MSSTSSELSGLNCNNCGRFTEFRMCMSDKNGNKGRLVALCHRISDDGTKCSFIRWQPGSSKSPSLSPKFPAAPTFPASLALLPQSDKKTSACPINGCGQSRLAIDCLRGLCRRHCIHEGGCSSKKHLVVAAPVLAKFSQPLTPSLTPSLTLPPPSRPVAPSSLSTSLAYPSLIPAAIATPLSVPDFTESRSAELLDARPNPRFASHLRPIYTEQLAREYELREKQRSADAHRIASSKRAKEEVSVFSWSTNDGPPSMRIFQSGFTWPYFVLTPAILLSIGLSAACERQDLQIYEEEFDTWVAVDEGHTIEVQEGHSIFAKDRLVHNCPGLKKHLKAPAQARSNMPHLRYGLASERTFVREAFKEQAKFSLGPNMLSSSPVKHERSLSPSPLYFPSSPPSLSHSYPVSQPIIPESTPTANGTVEDPIIIKDTNEKQWPGDFYVCDVVACFRDCKTRVRGRHAHTPKAIFNEHFPGVRFRSSTYYDQKKMWREAPMQLQDRFIDAGRVKSACWSAFSRSIRIDDKKKAAVRLCSPIELTDSE